MSQMRARKERRHEGLARNVFGRGGGTFFRLRDAHGGYRGRDEDKGVARVYRDGQARGAAQLAGHVAGIGSHVDASPGSGDEGGGGRFVDGNRFDGV